MERFQSKKLNLKIDLKLICMEVNSVFDKKKLHRDSEELTYSCNITKALIIKPATQLIQ